MYYGINWACALHLKHILEKNQGEYFTRSLKKIEEDFNWGNLIDPLASLGFTLNLYKYYRMVWGIYWIIKEAKESLGEIPREMKESLKEEFGTVFIKRK